MTLSYTTGLAIGSLLAYMLDACLGPVVQIKDICSNMSKSSPAAVGNITLGVLTNVAKATVETVTRIPKLETTTTALTTALTTSFVTNGTMSVLSAGILNATSTALPKIVANASSTISNTILQHYG